MNHKEYVVKVFSDKTEWYNKERKFHREDGPAIEWADGQKAWYINGNLHREDGPAVEWTNGHKEWYINGNRHREDGPAIEWASGSKKWWINGKELSEQEFLKRSQDVVLSMDEIAKKFGVPIEKLKIKK